MVTPNPASTSVRVTVASDKEFIGSILLVAVDGRELTLRNDQLVAVGTQTIELPLTDLSSGTYRIVVRDGNAQVSAPLMIVR
jgi:hypothetical protein